MISSLGSSFGGLLFGISWMLWIDGVAYAKVHHGQAVNGVYWIPGVLQTVALVMVNVISWAALTGDGLLEEGGGCFVRLWAFVAFVLAFGGIISSAWILVNEMNDPSWGEGSVEPAIRGLLQNLFIFTASLLFRLTRLKAD